MCILWFLYEPMVPMVPIWFHMNQPCNANGPGLSGVPNTEQTTERATSVTTGRIYAMHAMRDNNAAVDSFVVLLELRQQALAR